MGRLITDPFAQTTRVSRAKQGSQTENGGNNFFMRSRILMTAILFVLLFSFHTAAEAKGFYKTNKKSTVVRFQKAGWSCKQNQKNARFRFSCVQEKQKQSSTTAWRPRRIKNPNTVSANTGSTTTFNPVVGTVLIRPLAAKNSALTSRPTDTRNRTKRDKKTGKTYTVKVAHGFFDWSAPGTNVEVVASADGEVTFAGNANGLGPTVVIRHAPGLFTYYAHNSKLSVYVGQIVTRGQRIATMGAEGWTNGKPNVHWGAFKSYSFVSNCILIPRTDRFSLEEMQKMMPQERLIAVKASKVKKSQRLIAKM